MYRMHVNAKVNSVTSTLGSANDCTAIIEERSDTMTPPFCNPMRTSMRPIPTEIASCNEAGMAVLSFSTSEVMLMAMKQMPDIAVTANACCHVNPMP